MLPPRSKTQDHSPWTCHVWSKVKQRSWWFIVKRHGVYSTCRVTASPRLWHYDDCFYMRCGWQIHTPEAYTTSVNALYESRVQHSTQSKCFSMLFLSVILSPSAGRIMEATCSVQTLNILMHESTLPCYKAQSTSLKTKHMLRWYSATDVLINKTLNTGCMFTIHQ